MLKILFVTNQIPFPPDNGVRIVSHNAMRLMYEAGHKLALAVLTEEIDNLDDRFSNIKAYCQDGHSWWMQLPVRSNMQIQLSATLSNRLFPIERYRCDAFRQKLKNLIEIFKPDVVHFDIITMSQYRDAVPVGIGTIASINDSYSLTLENLLAAGQYTGLQRLYRKYQLIQTRRYEAVTYSKFNAVHVMTDVDAQYLRKFNNDINSVVIPNGVNPSLFNIVTKTSERFDILFVAKLVGENLYSLQEFLKNSWPIVIDKFPDAKLHIIGELSNEAIIVRDKFRELKGVIFLGYVNHLEDAYSRCGIAIVPINKNCGIVNKAIEAMVSGLAVVGFDKTFAGIKGAEAGVHFISVSDYQAMGTAVADLLSDKSRCQAIKQAAHVFAVDHYSWSSRSAAYEEMYLQAASSASELSETKS